MAELGASDYRIRAIAKVMNHTTAGQPKPQKSQAHPKMNDQGDVSRGCNVFSPSGTSVAKPSVSTLG